MSTPTPTPLGLEGVIAVANNKGGCGKTSVCANLAGLTAAAGIRTLVVDFDPQGNLGRDLGLESQDGLQLRRALEDGAPLPVTLDPRRENLGVVQSGPRLEEIISLQVARGYGAPSLAELLHQSLSAVLPDWDLIIFDTSPGHRPLVEAVFSNAQAVVLVSRADERNYDGVAQTGQWFHNVHETTNPGVQLLGVALFDIDSQAVKIEAGARQVLNEMLAGLAFDPAVFTARIRHSSAAAVDTRQRGKLIHELEGDVAQAYQERFAAIRDGRPPAFHSRSLDGVAGDYAALAEEILGRLQSLEGGQR